ncbi:protein broad-minded-like [Fopius arisanus]|uniref:Protein broad-minded-like n=1 Tax=Fopius arisanus TaxID=64838 RepID=A0A9R1TVN4_9HYME|nr:PREDICTED: protein broad-minded-like [Fopius arisanus]
MTESREVDEIITALKRMKNSVDIEETLQSSVNLENIDENIQSYRSDDLTSETWCPQMENNNLSSIFQEISPDRPVHVRLAGFETLFESDLSSNSNTEAFEQLLKLLKEGIADSTKAVFEASLKIHTKLLDSPRSHDVYTNLMNSFEAEYYSEKFQECFPNFGTGINFKIFFHEKLLRILHVIVKYQKELLKSTRNVDRSLEEMIDQFLMLLTCNENKKSLHCKNLSVMNLVSLLEPQADWSAKWMHSVATRKTFIGALSKSPVLLQTMGEIVQKGLECPFNGSLAFSIKDDAVQSIYRSVYISGDTVETITYLHCLNLVAQTINWIEPSAMVVGDDFTLLLVNSLNSLATSTTPKTIYNASQNALKIILDRPTYAFDSSVGDAALMPLRNFMTESNGNLWPHTLDFINFMLDSDDGLTFFTSQYQCISPREVSPFTPASDFLDYTSNLLRQPIALMNVDHVVQVLALVGKLFSVLENFNIIQEPLRNTLYPSMEYFYNKIQKYSIRHENSCQLLDSAIQETLLKIVAWPLGLQLLMKYQLTFEELIRGCINPFRHSWSSNEIISFISSVSHFNAGSKLMADLVPHTVSMLLDEINDNIDKEENLADLRDCEHIQKFIHVLSLFSLNTKCFFIFMMEEDSTEDTAGYPRNLGQLFKHSITIDSPFHYISLLSLETVIWNLDVLIYLMTRYDLQLKLLELQESCVMEVTKKKEKPEEEFSDGENCVEGNGIEETHEVHLIDESSLLRHSILSKSYYIRHKLEKLTSDENPQESRLYSAFPPPTPENKGSFSFSGASSELEEFLDGCKSETGLRDSGWVVQIRNAYGNSQGPMKHSTYMTLLEQMERAIAAVEWVDVYKWNSESIPSYEWLPEEDVGLDLVIRLAEDHWEASDNKQNVKDDLKKVFESVHTFIQYPRAGYFEGFDWFLGTVFVICGGNLDRCKTFVKNIVRFPSGIYMWNFLGISHDASNRGLTPQFLLAQGIDSIVTQEFPVLNYAMTNEFGVKWWMICNRFLLQCFWGVLEWSEIMHFMAICVLYSPDYIIYYCVSLLQHCEEKIMQDIVDKKYWPENIDLSSYQCHNYLVYMDRLEKKYQNQILPSLTLNKSTEMQQ